MFIDKKELEKLENYDEIKKVIYKVEEVCGVCKKVCDEKSVNCGNPQCPLSKKLYS